MKCKLCEQEIPDYNTALNHLVIDEYHEVDICQACVDAFVKWQGKIFATLFPTKALKKRYGGKME